MFEPSFGKTMEIDGEIDGGGGAPTAEKVVVASVVGASLTKVTVDPENVSKMVTGGGVAAVSVTKDRVVDGVTNVVSCVIVEVRVTDVVYVTLPFVLVMTVTGHVVVVYVFVLVS